MMVLSAPPEANVWPSGLTATLKTPADNFFQHYAHLSEEPKVYYVYPPCSTSKFMGVVYSKVPTALTAVGDTYPLADEYINSAVTYVIYRALTKEGRDTLPSAYRQELWENYLNTLALEKASREKVSAMPRPPEAE